MMTYLVEIDHLYCEKPNAINNYQVGIVYTSHKHGDFGDRLYGIGLPH